jgi:hypothetical protein
MAREEKVTLNLGYLQFSKSAIEAIRKQDGREDPGPVLASLATYYLNHHGSGALLLTGQQVAQLEKTTGKEFSTGDEVVKAIQHAEKRDDGNYTVSAQIDPAYYDNLRQVAEWRSSTIDDVLQDCLNTCLNNSWLESWEGKGGAIQLTAEDRAALEEIIGKKSFFGRDIVKALKAATVNA